MNDRTDRRDRDARRRQSGPNRRELLGALGATGTLGLSGCTGVADSIRGLGGAEEYENPVFEPVFADPTLIRTDDGTWYAYATEDDWGDGEGFRTVPILRTDDLVEWEYVGEVFGRRRSTGVDPSSDDPTWKHNGHGVWAPDIAHHDGRYLLYYSLFGPEPRDSAIGVATADDPEGPFEDQGEVVGGGGNVIDPAFVRDEGGTPYLFFGSYGQPIYAAELSADGTEVVGDWVRVARDGYEAPYVIERDGYYYLFVSAGMCCDGHQSDYHVRIGRSESLLGPYVDEDGTDLDGFGGTTILEASERFVGPGHNAVATDDDGTDWIVYHGYDTTESPWAGGVAPRRSLLIDRIEWEDGWPTIADETPSETATGPTIS